MNVRRRLILGLTVGIGLSLLSLAFGGSMLSQAHSRGWSGVQITPPEHRARVSAGKTQASAGPFVPQTLMFSYPDSPADVGGLKMGDRVVAVAGADFKDTSGLAAVDARVKRGDVVVYTVERGGKTLQIPIRFASPYAGVLPIVQLIVLGSVALVFLLTGFFVFSRKPDDRRVVVFYALTLVSGVSMLGLTPAGVATSNWRGIVWEPHGLDYLPLIALAAVAFASVPLTLHLALIFPRDRPVVTATPHVLRWVYGLPLAMLAAATLFALAIGAKNTLRNAPHAVGLRAICATFAAIALIATIAAVAVLLRRRDASRRRALFGRPITTMAATLIVLAAAGVLALSLDLRKTSVAPIILMFLLPAFGILLMPVLSCVSLLRSYREANVEWSAGWERCF